MCKFYISTLVGVLSTEHEYCTENFVLGNYSEISRSKINSFCIADKQQVLCLSTNHTLPFSHEDVSYETSVAVRYTERKLRPVRLTGNISYTAQCDMRSTTELHHL